jgi:hypothetical protein
VERAIAHVIAKRRIAAHPRALGLRCRDLIADAFANHLSLELSEREQHVASIAIAERRAQHARTLSSRMKWFSSAKCSSTRFSVG